MNDLNPIRPGDVWTYTSQPTISTMRFIRVGEYVLALDHIVSADGLSADNPTITLSFTYGWQQDFVGAEAAALRAFFAENAFDITQEDASERAP